MKKTCFILLFCFAILVSADSLVLRGYGKVNAQFRPGSVTFTCESPEKADIVYAKLYRDLTMMGARPGRESIKNGIPVLVFENGKTAAIGMKKGNGVVILDAASPSELLKHKELTSLTFPKRKPYPVFYDYYDLRAMKFYKGAMNSFLKYGLETHWPFAKKHHIEGFVLHTNFTFSVMPAPGVYNDTATDYELESAKKTDGLVTFCAGFGGALPLWMYNWNPENCAKVQDSTVVSEWQHGVEAGTYESYGKTLDPEHSPLRAFQKTVMEKYRNHPNLGGWQLYRGAPIGDQLGMGMNGVLWDSSAGAKKAFREWLKEKYSLPEIGKRWKGNPNAYSDWEQVEFLQLMDMIGGNYDTGRLLLSDREWSWSVTPKDAYGKLPEAGAKWLKIHFPPSQRCNYLDTGSGYYKLELNAPLWLKKRTDKVLYLKAAVTMWDSSNLQGWINGKFLKGNPVASSGTKLTELVIPPGTLRGDGSDTIILQTPAGYHRGDGRIHGPISLSERPAENFPYADPCVNARFYDAQMFQIDVLIRRNLEMYRLARSIDPDRPLSISGADVPILTSLAPFCGEHGISMQSTSIDAFFYPTLSSWGSLYGFYFTAESSQPIAGANFDSVLGQTFYQGSSASAIFMDIEQYMDFEKKTGKMTQRGPLLAHFGKYLLESPQIGLLNTSQTYQLGGLGPWNWALGRGELPSAHYPSCMVTEKELFNRKAFQFPVILDSSDVMTEETVDAIRKYVEKGGTFLAIPVSGRHTVLKQNAQILSKLSGFLTETSPMRGTIRFSDTQTVFPAWRGKTMNGEGSAFDWKYIPSATSSRLIKRSLDAEVLAQWQDGTPAVGMRRIGKGRIITFGSAFFRDGRDIAGKWLPSKRNLILEELFAQLGIERSVYADTERLWLRKAITKNGLEDWVIAHNVSENQQPEICADIRVVTGYTPSKVYDAVTGKTIPFKMAEKGTVLLSGMKFEKHETRIIAIPRPESVSAALKTWWMEKEKYWKKGADIKELPVTPLAPVTVSLNQWFFSPENKTTGGTAWTTAPVSSSNWRKVSCGSWKILHPDLKDYQGSGYYRQEFEIPADWNGHKIHFQFNTRTAIREKAVFYLNGKEFLSFDWSKQHPEFHGILSKDITALLRKKGKNILAVKLTGGQSILSGICDAVWFSKERKLSSEISLNGAWECVKGDLVTAVPTSIPGSIHGRYLRRRFTVPADWKGKRIFLRLETPVINVSSVMMNDRAKGLNGAFPPFGNMEEINISDLVVPGKENTIELWHRHTIPTNYIGVQWRWPKESKISVDHVVIGIEKEEKK